MKKQQKQGLLKRTLVRCLVWRESPFAIISSIFKVMFSTKVNPDELSAFRKLTPGQRWENVKKPSWTDEQLSKERDMSRLLSYIFLCCGLLICTATGLTFEYLNGFQFSGALAYGGVAFLMFARKSMWCYAINNKKVILFEEWLRMPGEWIP